MPAHIITRTTMHGEKRYLVRCQPAGRYSRILHLGSFKTKKEAEACKSWANLELAQGRTPDRRARLAAETLQPTVREAAEQWLASRVDLSDSSRATYAAHLRRSAATNLPVWNLLVNRVSLTDVQAFVGALVEKRVAPASVRRYTTILRQALDHAGVEPNPVRDRRVRMPMMLVDEIQPPSSREVRLILECVTPRHRLKIALLEATALRISDLLGLTWGDVDLDGCRFRVQKSRGKSKSSRFVPVPPELLDLVAAETPLEDRLAGRRLFPGVKRESVNDAMGNACKLAGIPRYSPHDLRHRCLSRMIQAGVPVTIVAQIAGHARIAQTLETYAHVLIDVEEAWRHVLTLQASMARSASERRT